MKQYIWIAALWLALRACTHDKAKMAVPEASCNTPATVSFSNDIQPLFNQHCNTAGCHSGGSPAGNLDLSPGEAYAKLMQSGSGYIDTIHPNYSLLYVQMGPTAYDPMPPTGRLDDCKLKLILTWIQQKAKNN